MLRIVWRFVLPVHLFFQDLLQFVVHAGCQVSGLQVRHLVQLELVGLREPVGQPVFCNDEALAVVAEGLGWLGLLA